VDAALPNAGPSPIRISFSYLPDWAETGMWQTNNWNASMKDVKLGLLACYWYGTIDSTTPNGRLTDGPVMRIDMDGSVYRLASRKNKTELTADDLFVRRTSQR
jgi:hypothetical protein